MEFQIHKNLGTGISRTATYNQEKIEDQKLYKEVNEKILHEKQTIVQCSCKCDDSNSQISCPFGHPLYTGSLFTLEPETATTAAHSNS